MLRLTPMIRDKVPELVCTNRAEILSLHRDYWRSTRVVLVRGGGSNDAGSDGSELAPSDGSRRAADDGHATTGIIGGISNGVK